MNNKVKLNHSGKLRILQVSDAQDLHAARPAMLRMLSTAYDLINPDLVLLTGDNILGNHLDDAKIRYPKGGQDTRRLLQEAEKSRSITFCSRLKKEISRLPLYSATMTI